MSITTQYLDATRKIQDSWFAAFDAAAEQATRGVQAPTMTMAPVAEPRKVVTDWFDFAERALHVQRETALRLIEANAQVTSQWRAQAQRAQSTWNEQVKVATDTIRQQSETFAAAGREQAQQYGEKFESQARQFASATTDRVRQAQQTAASAAAQTAETTKQATDQAAAQGAQAAKRNYTLMNSAQLKSELAARHLPATGTLDEMRTRLRDHDAQA